MTTYYLSTTGSDSNDGLSLATAWLTFTKALVTSGIPTTGGPHTLLVAAGTYAENTGGTGKLNITKAFGTMTTVQPLNPGSTVVITGTIGVENIQINNTTTNLTFKNITFQGRAGSTYVVHLYNNNGAITGLVFDTCSFIDDAATSDMRNLYLEAYNASTIDCQCLNCTFTNGSNGVHAAVSLVGTATSNHTFTFTNCNMTIPLKTVAGIDARGGTFYFTNCNISAGRLPLEFGYDGTTTLVSTGYVKDSVFTSTGDHGLMIGQGADSVEVSNVVSSAAGHALVLKGTNISVKRSVFSGSGPLPAILFKGCQHANVSNCQVKVFAGSAIANYDGVSSSGHGNSFTNNTVFVMPGSNGRVIGTWDLRGEDGTIPTVIDYNVYKPLPPQMYGVVLGSSLLQTIPALRAAWATYGDGSNDSHSRQYVPQQFVRLDERLIIF